MTSIIMLIIIESEESTQIKVFCQRKSSENSRKNLALVVVLRKELITGLKDLLNGPFLNIIGFEKITSGGPTLFRRLNSRAFILRRVKIIYLSRSCDYIFLE